MLDLNQSVKVMSYLHHRLYTKSIDQAWEGDRGRPIHGFHVYLLRYEASLVNLTANQDAGNWNTMVKNQSIIYKSRWILNLTTAHQNLAGKLSEAFTIDSDDVAIHAKFGPCSAIW